MEPSASASASARDYSVTTHAAPQTIPDANATNSMMVRELNETSAAERERAYEDIHGVTKEIVEKPEFVSKCLNDMQTAINDIREKSAYELALAQSPEYARGRSMLLMFLRSTDFNPKRAAQKIVKFFEHKRFYFGDDNEEILGRPILYSDLNNFDLECLRIGWLQVLPFRDKSGRVVVCSHVPSFPDKRAVNVMRAVLYASMTMADDKDLQKRGVVFVTLGNLGRKLTTNLVESAWHVGILLSYLPFKLAAIHICIKKAKIATPLLPVLSYGMGKDSRIRHRVHVGTQTEWYYSLMTFGIPVDYIPLTHGGELKTRNYREWLTQTRTLESNRLDEISSFDTQNIVLIPRWTDGLCGQGCSAQNYVGNRLFHQIFDEYRQQYQSVTSKKKKLQITIQVYDLLKKENIRLLERNKQGFWEEICHFEGIKEKIMYRLRLKIKTTKPGPKVKHKEDQDNPPPSFLNQTGEMDKLEACCRPPTEQEEIQERKQRQRL